MTEAVTWGHRGTQLLPSSLGLRWADIRLPAWVATLAQLPQGSPASALCKPLTADLSKHDWDHLIRFVINLTRERLTSISSIRVISEELARDFQPEAVAWSVRTSNALHQAGLMEDPKHLSQLTFGEVLRLPNVGVRSALDFAVTLETHLQQQTVYRDEPQVKQIELLVDEMRPGLVEAASEDWAESVAGTDPRFTDLLGRDPRTVSERIEQALESDDQSTISALCTNIPELRARIEMFDSQPLERALLGLFIATLTGKRDRIPALIRRFGWDGKPPETLEQVGKRLGVTRERIRQIEAKIVRRMPDTPMYLPQLQKAIEALESASPISIRDASDLLKRRGICERPFHPESVISAAEDCNLPTSLRIQTVRGKKLVTSKSDLGVAGRLATIARKQCGASGATDIPEVLEQARSENLTFDDERAERLIRNLPDISWLEDDWFWTSSIPSERNRLRNVARKMLSVTSPIHAQKIRNGMRRVASWRNSTVANRRWPFRAPPTQIVRRFLEQHSEFSVDESGLVSSNLELDYVHELGDAERAIVEAIRSSPTRILDRQSIRDKCLSKGINAHSVEVLLSYSPLIEHLGVNLWTIAGTAIDPASLEAVKTANAERPREKRISDFGWTESGDIWIAVVIPAYHTSSFVFGIPGGVKRFLCGQKFSILDESGRERGHIGVTDTGAAYGAGPTLRRKAADTGDTMLCEFNLTRNVVMIRVGGEELTADL